MWRARRVNSDRARPLKYTNVQIFLGDDKDEAVRDKIIFAWKLYTVYQYVIIFQLCNH